MGKARVVSFVSFVLSGAESACALITVGSSDKSNIAMDGIDGMVGEFVSSARKCAEAGVVGTVDIVDIVSKEEQGRTRTNKEVIGGRFRAHDGACPLQKCSLFLPFYIRLKMQCNQYSACNGHVTDM